MMKHFALANSGYKQRELGPIMILVDQKNSKIQTFKKFIGVKLHSLLTLYLRISQASRYLFRSLAGHGGTAWPYMAYAIQ
jgi:hypothetical protein